MPFCICIPVVFVLYVLLCVCVFCVCIYVCLILAELYDDLPIKAFECEILNMNPCLWCYSTCIAIHLFTVILSLFAVKWLHLGSFFYPFHWFKFSQRPQLSIACTGSPILILVIFTKTAQYFLVSQKLQYTWINIHKKYLYNVYKTYGWIVIN